MTRRGVAGVRLCDVVVGCMLPWPCPAHGTRRFGDYEHLGRHAGQFALANTWPCGELDMAWCRQCRFALCCCPTAPAAALPVAPALRPGWTTDGEGYFNDAIALMVWPDGEKWRVYGNGNPWPYGFVTSGDFVLAERAMEFAELLSAQEKGTCRCCGHIHASSDTCGAHSAWVGG